MKILELKDIVYYYKDGNKRRVILDGICESFEEETFYAIIGESGSGKTTLLSLIGALDKPKEGKILYKGQDIDEIGYEKYRRNHIGFVFQSFNLIPYMTGLENVLVAMGITENELEKDKKAYAKRMLETVGIDEVTMNRRVNKISGGEQQRIAIARALSTKADIIVADEPTGNLDYENTEIIITVLKNLAHKMGKCVIVVTHDQKVAKQADVVLTIDSKTHTMSKQIRKFVV